MADIDENVTDGALAAVDSALGINTDDTEPGKDEKTPETDDMADDIDTDDGVDDEESADDDESEGEQGEETQDDEDPDEEPRGEKRYQELVQNLKDKDAELETTKAEFTQLQAQYESITNAIHRTGAKPEELSKVLAMLSFRNDGDHENQLAIAEELYRDACMRAGKPIAGEATYKRYEDLVEQVESLAMTETAANELAMHRDRARQLEEEERTKTEESQAQQQQDDAAARKTAGIEAAEAVEDELRKKYPNFDDVLAACQDEYVEHLKKLPPESWGESTRYFLEGKLAAAKPRRRSARPASGSSKKAGVRTEPMTGLQALDFALDGE